MKGVKGCTIGFFVFAFSLLSFSPNSAYAGVYSGGDGSAEDPFQIATPNDLNEVGNYPNDWDKHFILTADINMADYTYTTALIAPDIDQWNSEFDGIPFTGIFDGNNFIIKNLIIDDDGQRNDFLGIFGQLGSGCHIKNVTLENIQIIAGDYSDYLGTLCGYNKFGYISFCSTTGSVIGHSYLGGLCGSNSGKIVNCSSATSVDGYNHLGSLTGWNDRMLERSYATGTVTGRDYIGGLCGFNDEDSINNCYATGDVFGGASSRRVGGLCGSNRNGTISNCYATGSVTGFDYLGGLCGDEYDYSYFNNSYFLHPSDGGGPDNGLGTPLTDEQMKQQSSFIGWDFVNKYSDGTNEIWQMMADDYPVLSFFEGFIPPELIGSGSESDPWLVRDPNELGAIMYYDPEGYYRLDANINMEGIIFSVSPIPLLRGSFDGNDFVISNLTIDTYGARYSLGLVSEVSGLSQIKDLSVLDVNIAGGDSSYLGAICGFLNGTISDTNVTGIISGNSYLGGICGFNNSGVIDNCNVNATLSNSSGFIGGICGKNLFGSIYNSNSTGSVYAGNGSKNIGGICGYNDEGPIINCYAICTVSGDGYLGGICGRNVNGNISSCYATGDVTGDYYVGGFCGWNDDGTISNCYANGNVTADNVIVDYGGGFLGYNDAGNISHCYATGLVSGNNYLGGFAGRNGDGVIKRCYFLHPSDGGGPDNGIGFPLTDEQMKQQSSFMGWDFTGESTNGTNQVWQILSESYPLLTRFTEYIPIELLGYGTEQEPWLIHDSNEFGAIYHYSPEGYYRLENNISLENITWSVAPIPFFKGSFDGAGFTISNIKISGGDYLGLFGSILADGIVKELGVDAININATDYSNHIGGICGFNNHGTIIKSYVIGSISSGNDSQSIGGLCGENYGTISNCFTSTSVSVYDNSRSIGGLCGTNKYSLSNISDCYSIGIVSGGDNSSYLGGFCGYISGGAINTSYSACSVASGNGSSYTGGFCGRKPTGTINDCYFLDPIDGGGPDNGWGTPLTDIQMKQQSSFIDWDFLNTWDLTCEGISYPRLIWQIVPVDYLCPQGVDFLDYGFFADYYGLTDCNDINDCNSTDLDFSGAVDINDVNIFTNYWLFGKE